MTGVAEPRRLLSKRSRSATSSAIRDLLKLTEQPGILSLAGGLPSAASFPVDALRRQADEILAADGHYGAGALQYGRTEGVTELRELLGAACGASFEHVLVTTGSQQALDLLGRCLIDLGDVIVVESPSYIGALQALRSYEPAFAPVAGDDAGLDTAELEERLRAGLRPTACYVVSNFANPTGATLSLARREHLLDLARRYEFVIIEDDPYGELRFRGDPLPAIRDLPDADEHVALVRTVSKTLVPGLRLGWAVLPPWLVDPMVIAKQAVDLHTSTVSQHLALGLLADADAQAARVRASAALYGRHAEALSTALARHLGERLEVGAVDGGMFLWARCTDPAVDTVALLRVALEHGVAFVPGAPFFAHAPGDDEPPPSTFLRMSYATLAEAQFDEAARRLALAFAT